MKQNSQTGGCKTKTLSLKKRKKSDVISSGFTAMSNTFHITYENIICILYLYA